MDDYPKHLTPPKDFRGNVDQDKFHEWWPSAKAHFPNVPENAAHYWIYENWGVSPYDYLASRRYRFQLVEWPAERLFELKSESGDFDQTLAENIKHGKRMCTKSEFGDYLPKLSRYVMEHKSFPHPIVILDNRDGHMAEEYSRASRVPPGYVLIEGHCRMDLGLFLHSEGHFGPTFNAWLMTKIPA